MRGAGGTPGGIGEFFLGCMMTGAGGYLLTNQIKVTTGFWSLRYQLFGDFGVSAFGITLLPLIGGIFFLFLDGGSKLGWILALGSLAAILIGVLTTLQVVWQTTSLYVLLGMLVLLAGGLGLIARSLKSHE